MTESRIPVVPSVDPTLLEQHAERRIAVTERIGRLPTPVGRVFRFCAHVRVVDALANLFLDDRSLLFPPRRRHLHPSLEARRGGCTSVFEYIDARLEMRRRGHLDDVVGPESPHVINAFAESHDHSPTVTNPGLVRLTGSGFDVTQSEFRPPDGRDCAALLGECVTTVNESDQPAIVKAGWLAAALLAIHPFVDGNGRTARSLFQLVSSSDEVARFDWATIEQWAIDRHGYVESLKASQRPSMPEYDGARVDTLPFVLFAIRSSLVGLGMIDRRIDWFERAAERLADDREEAGVVEAAVVTTGSSRIDELAELVPDPECTDTVGRLVSAGRLVWDRRGLLRPGPTSALTGIGA